MRRTTLIILSLIATVAFASTVQRPTLHDFPVSRFDVLHRLDGSDEIEMRFALKQRNLDELASWLDRVSDPSSPTYKHYATLEQVMDLVAPPKQFQELVVSWLTRGGVSSAESFGDFVVARASVATFESLLSTELYAVQHRETGMVYSPRVISGHYSLPTFLSKVISFVQEIGQFNTRYHASATTSASPSNDMVVPQTLRNNYNISDYTIATNSSISVGEFAKDHAFKQSDLEQFCSGTNVSLPNPITHHGPFDSNPADGEATLDVQMAMASIAWNSTNQYYTMSGWLLEYAQELLTNPQRSLVNSISWLSPEQEEGRVSVNRVNVAFSQLGLLGVTMVASSGDEGADGGNCRSFSPGFPASSIYALSVGATELIQGTTTPFAVGEKPSVCEKPEYTCAASGQENPASEPLGGYASGGGFSAFQPQPSWQSDAVQAYLSSGVSLPPANLYNSSNRGYPDTASLGLNILIYVNARWEPVGGTSAAAPAWGGFLAMINDHLMLQGEAPLGFVNPLIYKAAAENPKSMVPIGTGTTNNKDGCENGWFSDPTGWDPVTGNGIINFGIMLDYIDTLPAGYTPISETGSSQ